ncbi:uncharacterized protein [Palaemon carinicauda]|uniref:uncharacterized protein n=1 Tax=Palaemon carinicauda TaxID=392227 RepID=UPI0035B5F97C
MNLEDLFSEKEDSLDVTQEETLRVSPREEERQTNEQEAKKVMDLEEIENSALEVGQEKDIVVARELLEEAEDEFVAKQGPVGPQTEGTKAEGDLEAENRQIAAEENWIKLKMASREKEWKQDEKKKRGKKHDVQRKWKQDRKKERQNEKKKKRKKPEKSQDMRGEWKKKRWNEK